MNFQKVQKLIKEKPMLAYLCLGGVILCLFGGQIFFRSSTERNKTGNEHENYKNAPIGLSVGAVDQQAYIARLEKNYYDFDDRVKKVEENVKNVTVSLRAIEKSQRKFNKIITNVDQKIMNKLEERLSEFNQGGFNPSRSGVELAIADIKPLQHQEDDVVYLPIGSFCKGTLLTGVYAAADVNNPLPVLISLDEAFYGPNKTRVPLKGAFILGKAYGDIVSERALIQIVAVSAVLPNGHAFEKEENLGYVTDAAGELGLHGQIIRNTGKALALSFMGGFLAGGSQAVADGEVTTSDTRYGGVRHDVTGDASKHALFSGLAKSAGRMSDYYEKQADNLIPAVHISSGSTVYFIVQKGVQIEGLQRVNTVHVSNLN